MNDIYVNTLTLRQLGFYPIENYSRYMIRKEHVMSIVRMRLITRRPDRRFNLISDTGRRSPVHLCRLKRLP